MAAPATRASTLAAALLCALAASGHADPEPAQPRPLRWNLHAGGYGALTGPADYGPVAAVEVLPGGRLGRLGATVRWRGFEGTGAGWLTGGWVYEAAAARPRLVLSLHGEAGASYGGDRAPVAGGGATSRLWLAGPLYVGTDGGAHLIYDGVDSRLVFGFGVIVGLGR